MMEFIEAMGNAFYAIFLGFKFLLTTPVLNVFFIIMVALTVIRIVVNYRRKNNRK